MQRYEPEYDDLEPDDDGAWVRYDDAIAEPERFVRWLYGLDCRLCDLVAGGHRKLPLDDAVKLVRAWSTREED